MTMADEGSLLSVRRIYYRGKLNSCNYTCSYCPFGKKSHRPSTAQDRQAWNRFITAIEQWKGETLQLFVIPYGEALIHRYYREGIVRLAALPHVAGISCQTNLSFLADEWLSELRAIPALRGKIRIWASFHPEMTTVERFAGQLHRLCKEGIQVCAGAVGNPSAKNVLNELRKALSPEIYLFINAMQGLKSPLSDEDVRFFTRLDNLFEYDLHNAPAQWEHCASGRTSCFIDWKGNIFACPRSKVKIGNLYRNQTLDTSLPCRRKVCDCYIAFSNLTNHPLRRVMGEGAFWRIPDRPLITAVFFDVDGTLTDTQGRVPESYADTLRYMAESVPLYLATSLSVEQARRKLGKALFGLFKGGVFADGGLLLYGNGQHLCLPVELPSDINEESVRITAHSYQGQIYKYSILIRDKERREECLSRFEENSCRIFYRPPLIAVTHRQAGKKRGVLQICEKLSLPLGQVLVVGNSLHDCEMMAAVHHSCAVVNSEPLLKERARYTLNPDRLPAFFRFRK